MGVVVKSQIAKLLLLSLGSFILIATFQNCSQAGSISATETPLSKVSAPLVGDVVDEMQNQEAVDDIKNNEQIQIIDHDKEKDQANKEDKKDYEGEVGQVLEGHACDDGSNEQSKKVLVCHYPPGNAAARHEICISRSALKAHINHGHDNADHQDHLGNCDAEVEENSL